ncbi:MAG: HipA domain-containing protein, partial [Micrococcales bacterium]|nr:HipA domain-containing protein [Micrococcales bacterium]
MPARFSLAGSQAKFALADAGGTWLWPNATWPSTHILKPPSPRHPDIDTLEVATLHLAHLTGLPAPHAAILKVAGQSSFTVARFDRAPQCDGPARRLRAEDMAQALGVSPDRKYQVSATTVINLLRRVDPTGDLPLSFIRQLAFNTAIGNADAHAKNYSILLDETGARLAPMYDALPIGAWPMY